MRSLATSQRSKWNQPVKSGSVMRYAPASVHSVSLKHPSVLTSISLTVSSSSCSLPVSPHPTSSRLFKNMQRLSCVLVPSRARSSRRLCYTIELSNFSPVIQTCAEQRGRALCISCLSNHAGTWYDARLPIASGY